MIIIIIIIMIKIITMIIIMMIIIMIVIIIVIVIEMKYCDNRNKKCIMKLQKNKVDINSFITKERDSDMDR